MIYCCASSLLSTFIEDFAKTTEGHHHKKISTVASRFIVNSSALYQGVGQVNLACRLASISVPIFSCYPLIALATAGATISWTSRWLRSESR